MRFDSASSTAFLLCISLVHSSPIDTSKSSETSDLIQRDGLDLGWLAEVTAADLVITDPPVNPASNVLGRYYSGKCDLTKRFQIEYAWNDAAKIVNSMGAYGSSGYDRVRSQWLGADWKKQSDKNTGKFVYNVWQGIQLLYGGHFLAPKNTYIYFYCDDYANECEENTLAYEEDADWNFWQSHYINLCPAFFKSPTLNDTLVKYKNDKTGQGIINNFQETTAATLLHETYHMKPTVSTVKLIDLSYTPSVMEDIASKDGTDYAKYNAESWTLMGLGNYVQRYYNLAKPPVADRSTSATVSMNRYKVLSNTPQGKATFPNNQSPDGAAWIPLTPQH